MWETRYQLLAELKSVEAEKAQILHLQDHVQKLKQVLGDHITKDLPSQPKLKKGKKLRCAVKKVCKQVTSVVHQMKDKCRFTSHQVKHVPQLSVEETLTREVSELEGLVQRARASRDMILAEVQSADQTLTRHGMPLNTHWITSRPTVQSKASRPGLLSCLFGNKTHTAPVQDFIEMTFADNMVFDEDRQSLADTEWTVDSGVTYQDPEYFSSPQPESVLIEDETSRLEPLPPSLCAHFGQEDIKPTVENMSPRTPLEVDVEFSARSSNGDFVLDFGKCSDCPSAFSSHFKVNQWLEKEDDDNRMTPRSALDFDSVSLGASSVKFHELGFGQEFDVCSGSDRPSSATESAAEPESTFGSFWRRMREEHIREEELNRAQSKVHQRISEDLDTYRLSSSSTQNYNTVEQPYLQTTKIHQQTSRSEEEPVTVHDFDFDALAFSPSAVMSDCI